MMTIDEAKKLLEADGYVVLRAKSYRWAEDRRHRAQADAYWAKLDKEHAWVWARECRDDERKLADRCTYLYGLAARHGASDEELRGW